MKKELILMTVLAPLFASALECRITDFTTEGKLSWTTSQSNVYCGIEQRSNLTAGSWQKKDPPAYWNLRSANTNMSALISPHRPDRSMFYRVVCSTNYMESTCSRFSIIPSSGIRIDGDVGDWQGIAASIIDAAEEAALPAGSDLKTVYFSHDTTNLNVRIDLANGTPTPDMSFQISFESNAPTNRFIDIQVGSLSCTVEEALSGSNDQNTIAHGTLALGVGVLEASVPLSALRLMELNYVRCQSSATAHGVDVTDLHEAIYNVQGIENLRIAQEIESYLVSRDYSGAALVVTDQGTILKKGFGNVIRSGNDPIDADTVFQLASLTKQFTAAAIMILQQEGYLNVNDTVAAHIPDYPNGHLITLQHLMRHTSGIINYTTIPDFWLGAPFTPEELVALFKDNPLEFTPGRRYRYSNSGYALLGYIIERVSGMSYADYLQEKIFVPLGMSRTGYGYSVVNDANVAPGYDAETGAAALYDDMTIPYAAGALTSTLNDLIKWDQSFHDRTLLTEESQAQIFTPGRRSYGYGWVISNTGYGERVFHHGGVISGFTSHIVRYPDTNKLIVLLSNEVYVDLPEIWAAIDDRLH